MAGTDDEDFATLFAESEREHVRERRIVGGDVVRGRVIAIGATAAFVAVGGKAEATIDLGEFRDPATGEVQLHEGDDIEATVVDDGTRSGSIVLKRVAGRGAHVPGELSSRHQGACGEPEREADRELAGEHHRDPRVRPRR